MDLRECGVTATQLKQAKRLAGSGLICYQPFIFSNELETGAGYEFLKIAEGAGMVYCENPPADMVDNEHVKRHLIDPVLKPEFSEDNQRLRVLYESIIDLVEEKVGPAKELTVGDIGCCSGYFPLGFAMRGAKRAVGYDVVDYTPSFKLLNNILDTSAEFQNIGYRGFTSSIRGAEKFDVILSIAVLVHLSDPLHHLAVLGSLAKKAIVVWTYTSEDPPKELVIRYGSVNRYYKDAQFPFCFDICQLSPDMLKKSLELMGFTEMYPIVNRPDGMPDYWFERQRGWLAIRGSEPARTFSPEEYRRELSELSSGSPKLIHTLSEMNIVSQYGLFWGVPKAVGEIDLTQSDIRKIPGVVVGLTEWDVEKRAVSPWRIWGRIGVTMRRLMHRLRVRAIVGRLWRLVRASLRAGPR